MQRHHKGTPVEANQMQVKCFNLESGTFLALKRATTSFQSLAGPSKI